jgi:AcrR family transcriptional regulator
MTISTVHKKEKTRKVGRPRSARVHRAILDATLELVAAEGIQGASIEAIAERAGVGKTAIYRRWESKEALVSDAINTLHFKFKFTDTGNLRNDMIAMLKAMIHELETEPEHEMLYFRLMGEIKDHPEFLTQLHDRVFLPRLKYGQSLIKKAYQRGELREDYDIIILGGLIAGPLLYYMLINQLMPVSYKMEDLPEKIVDAILNGVGTGKS